MSEARVNRAACRMCVCLMCRCVLSAEPLPWCFSPAAPLRIPVLDRYHDRGVVAMGKVESGTLRAGQKVCIMPTKNTVKVEAIFIDAAEGATAFYVQRPIMGEGA